MTIKISMAAMNLKSLPDFLVLWYGTNVIDDLEFICFMITVSLGKFTCTISITNFRFAERDIIPRLSEALQLPHKIVCCQETVANNIEDLRILLLKTFLSLPFGLHGTTFGKKTLQKFVIFNYKLDYIYSKFNQLLSS